MHNGTGDFALIPSLYKTKPFTMHRPLAVAVDPLCGQSLDAEVYCIFANRSQFRADGRALTLDAGATLVRDSCHRKVVDACKATWAATGVTPTLQTCPKVLADYPPQSAEVNSETSKFLCDHEFSKCSTEVPVLNRWWSHVILTFGGQEKLDGVEKVEFGDEFRIVSLFCLQLLKVECF